MRTALPRARARTTSRCAIGDAARAARCAFWVGFDHLGRGDVAQGLGWLARAARVLDDRQLDCAERGYLLIPVAIRATDEGDYAAAYATFTKAGEIAERFGERGLATIARYGRGQALVRSGRTADGVALIDEAMVGITSGDVSPSVVGALYCSAIEVWKGIFDLRRAQEWTAALSRWCESQPDLVPFRGQCLVFRAEIMQLHGAWPDAMEEALRASERLSDTPGHPAAGAALYQQAELHRLRGDLVSAEEAYRQASQLGRSPHPGLARLRLAQGQVEAARVAMRGVMDEKHDRATRATLLLAYVEVLLAARDVSGARAATDELRTMAAEHRAPLLDALCAQATGAVLLGEGDARAALADLRKAWRAWRQLEAPYDAARVRVLVGLACRALEDEDGAEMEFDAARSTFQQLGAATDLMRLDELSRPTSAAAVAGWTDCPRATDPWSCRDREDEPRDRRRARDQREDRGPSCEQHLRQDRGLIARRRHGVRVRAQARVGVYTELPTPRPVLSWTVRPMRGTSA